MFCSFFRSYAGLSEWLNYLTYGTQVRYLSLFFSKLLIAENMNALPLGFRTPCTNRTEPLLCRFASGEDFLRERFGYTADFMPETTFTLTVALGFSLGLFIVNCIMYLIPLPAAIKAKFRQ